MTAFGPFSASGDGWADISSGTWEIIESIYVVVTATPPNQQFLGTLYPQTLQKAGYYGAGAQYGPPFTGTGRVIYLAYALRYQEQQFRTPPEFRSDGGAPAVWWRFPPGIVATIEVFY